MIRYIHGSEDSLDLDVFYVFPEMPTFREAQEFCSNKEENRNIIVVKDGCVTDCYKGTIDEINNGLYYTYGLHEQEFENIIKGTVERDVLIKVVRVVRCLLSHCSRTQYRTEVKKALKSQSWNLKINTLRKIDFDKIEDFGKSGSKEDVYKVFAFQLGQVMGLFANKEYYTKSLVAKRYSALKPYLYREKGLDAKNLQTFIDAFLHVVSYQVEETPDYVYFKEFNKKINLTKEIYLS